MDSLKRIQALAKIIFLDGMRRHAIIGLILLALLAELFGLVFVDFFAQDLGRAVNDFQFSAMWATGLIFLFFHAVQVIAWDEEHKVIFGIISRPISRSEYLIGVGIGLAALLLVLELTLGCMAYGSLLWLNSHLAANYFAVFNQGNFVLTWLGLVLSLLVVLSAILLFSGIVRGGFAVLIISIAYYFICSGLPVAREHIQTLIEKGETSASVGYFLQVLAFFFPDLSRMDFKNEVLIESLSISGYDILMQMGLGLIYIILAVLLACFAYGKRDIQ